MDTPRTSRILLGLLPAPLGWALQIGGGALLGWSCGSGPPLLLHGLSVVGLALALSAIVLCWRALQQADAAWRATGASDAAQARFIALGITILAFTITGAVVLTWVPLFVFDPCG